MRSMRPLIGRHAGVLLAVLISPIFVGVHSTQAPHLRVVLPEHEAHIVEFSPDSRVMLTDGASGGCIRDAATGRVLVRLMRTGANGPIPATDITWPQFTADSRHVIVQLGGPRFGPEVTVTLAVFCGGNGTGVCLVRKGRFGNLVGLGAGPRGVHAFGRRIHAGVQSGHRHSDGRAEWADDVRPAREGDSLGH